MSDKYVQIMPAPSNLYAIYDNDGEELESKIIMFALREDGDIEMLDMDSSGWIDDVRETSNFKRIEYK
ncbi:pathogenicity island protein [Staphylococcus pseudintermedius]|nr:pathogenicity island protein [Staphylococcus pseudintermedius]EIQ3656557.1 pathogenicity island protein [Staphylococcus pseudintermedius]EJN7321639.1 pathogenicity island protein [Staphylococcus pseudintermedius]EKF6163287.1 pathogenicity island protein [Staphylococcus pseudintermedius]EKO8573786.1 pathogenicity island protein [Staphylococcus pseudintermedius]